MLRVAEEALRRGHPDQAIIAYHKALARFRLMGQRLKQMAVLQHLVRLRPEDLEHVRELVDVYEELGRSQEATVARFRLAAMLRQRGLTEDADRIERQARADGALVDDLPQDDTGDGGEMPGEPVGVDQVPKRPPDLHLDLALPQITEGPRPTAPSRKLSRVASGTDDEPSFDIDWQTAPSVRARLRSSAARPAQDASVDLWALQDPGTEALMIRNTAP